MTAPKLRIRASGYGGSGYYNPLTGDKVIGVTTAVGALDKPGLKQWVADQTAYYAVANADKLLLKSEEQGFNMLRWYHTRAKESDFDNPLLDLNYYHSGVLNDAAELGTSVHEWVEAYLTGGFPPELVRDEQVQMVEAFLEWESQHDVEAVSTEMTVFGQGYGGTLDMIVEIDGVTFLVEIKTSRAVQNTHIAQLAAYGAATVALQEVPAGTPDAVSYKDSWWVGTSVPGFSKYGILQIRPDDYDNQGKFIPAFCKLHEITQAEIDAGFELYMASQNARIAGKALADAQKGVES